MTFEDATGQRSIRSSCDRCRMHKLKCTISYSGAYAEPHPCDRCGRAKAACVFSPRVTPRRLNRAAKISPTKKRNGSGSTTEAAAFAAVIPGTDSHREEEAVNQNSPLDTDHERTRIWNNHSLDEESSVVIDGIGLIDPELFSWNDSQRATHDTQADWRFPDLTSTVILSKQDTLGVGTGPYPNSRQDISFAKSPSSFLPDVSETGASDLTSEDENMTIVARLANLLTEISDTCNSLEDSAWPHQSGTDGLNDYPIGRVLHLSQHFIKILSREMTQIQSLQASVTLGLTSPVSCLEFSEPSPSCHWLSLARSIRGDLTISQTEGLEQQKLPHSIYGNHPDRTPAGHESVDTPTLLLALSSYMSLVKLCGIVFTHFEAYVVNLSGIKPQPGSVGGDLICSRQLQLGELPSGDESYRKIISAMRILISMIESAEDKLDIPSDMRAAREPVNNTVGKEFVGVRLGTPDDFGCQWTMSQRDLMLAVLRQDAQLRQGKPEGRFIDVSTRIQSLKKVLRERMNL
ncbi:hypothetical protein F5Y09DRAFT_322848 [Xylaria sp. FL1042]|nr:hypothetical protein F5Y09DRAFT_322848 [Xylaria sp. FL1042]